jgi:hypothetical protein
MTGPSPFERRVHHETEYDYWVASPQLTTGRGGRRRAPLAPDVYAPLGDPPRYYAVAWQVVLWVACAALTFAIIFG